MAARRFRGTQVRVKSRSVPSLSKRMPRMGEEGALNMAATMTAPRRKKRAKMQRRRIRILSASEGPRSTELPRIEALYFVQDRGGGRNSDGTRSFAGAQETRGSGAQALVFRVPGAVGDHDGAEALLQDDDLELGANFRRLRRHISQGQGLAAVVPVDAGGGAANHLAVSVERLVAAGVGDGASSPFLREDLESYQPLRHTLLLLTNQGVPAAELPLVQAHEALQPGFQRRVFPGQVAAPHAVGFLQAQHLHRPHADEAEVVLLPDAQQLPVEVAAVLDGVVQLPAQLADEVDPQGAHVAGKTDIDGPAGQPGEGLAREIGVAL